MRTYSRKNLVLNLKPLFGKNRLETNSYGQGRCLRKYHRTYSERLRRSSNGGARNEKKKKN